MTQTGPIHNYTRPRILVGNGTEAGKQADSPFDASDGDEGFLSRQPWQCWNWPPLNRCSFPFFFFGRRITGASHVWVSANLHSVAKSVLCYVHCQRKIRFRFLPGFLFGLFVFIWFWGVCVSVCIARRDVSFAQPQAYASFKVHPSRHVDQRLMDYVQTPGGWFSLAIWPKPGIKIREYIALVG